MDIMDFSKCNGDSLFIIYTIHEYPICSWVVFYYSKGVIITAERRMFAKSIVLSDAFLDMPMSARCLYFTLGMLADDDGFVGNPKSIMRQCGASQDDMAMLLQKRYVLGFDSGIIVIKHWRINNYLRNDRYQNTTYIEEKDTLELDAKNAYKEKALRVGIPGGIPNSGIPSIDKDSIDKDIILSSLHSDNISDKKSDYDAIIKKWNELEKYGIVSIRSINEGTERMKSVRARIRQYSLNEILEAIDNIKESDFLQGKHNGRPWQITFDWFILPTNFPKVLEGNYKNGNKFISDNNLSEGERRFLDNE